MNVYLSLCQMGNTEISMLNIEIPYYGKCPKISYTKVSDKMAYANSADPDQTAPSGAV